MMALFSMGMGALFSSGCLKAVHAPATELPALNTAAVAKASDWPRVRTSEGYSERIAGPIAQIDLHHAGGVHRIDKPFDASVVGNELQVTGPYGPRAYSLKGDPYIKITYTDKSEGFKVGGIAFLAMGTPFVIIGISMLSEGRGYLGLNELFGKASVGLGIGLWVPGIVLLAVSPKNSKPAQASTYPTLHVGPNGAAFSVKF